uniref:(northern house mosquito) hypothetical protein n=1 Tax=Culex pipiens TaxID=7175 RepID=A0A8D8NYA8_CULPI
MLFWHSLSDEVKSMTLVVSNSSRSSSESTVLSIVKRRLLGSDGSCGSSESFIICSYSWVLISSDSSSSSLRTEPFAFCTGLATCSITTGSPPFVPPTREPLAASCHTPASNWRPGLCLRALRCSICISSSRWSAGSLYRGSFTLM